MPNTRVALNASIGQGIYATKLIFVICAWVGAQARLVVCLLIAAGFNRFRSTKGGGNWKNGLETLQELPNLLRQRCSADGLAVGFRQERQPADALIPSSVPSTNTEV
jgi:hypothetical protein